MKRLSVLLAIMYSPLSLPAQTKNITYADADQRLVGVLAKPSSPLKNTPGILILPAWMGINEHSKNIAEKPAALGYRAFVADEWNCGNKKGEAGVEAIVDLGEFVQFFERGGVYYLK